MREHAQQTQPIEEEHPLIDSLTFQVITVCGRVLDVCERFDQEFRNDPR